MPVWRLALPAKAKHTEMLQAGTLQRLLAFAAFVPVGVVGYYVNETARPNQNPFVGRLED